MGAAASRRQWTRLSALHPLALSAGRGRRSKSGAIRRAETRAHARSKPTMQQIEAKPDAARPDAAHKRHRRISRSEREAARDRANLAVTARLFADAEPRADGGPARLLPEARDMLVGNRARLWRACLERACRRARACTAPFNLCIAEPRTPEERRRGHGMQVRFMRAQARAAAETESPDRADAQVRALAAGARQLRTAMRRLRAATPKPAGAGPKRAKRR